MRTRMHISLMVGDREELSNVAKNYAKTLEPGVEMIFMDALSDSHSCYGEGGKEDLFLWGIVGDVDPYSFLHNLSEFWELLLDGDAILENTHILFIWQSAKDSCAYSANIYQLRDKHIPIIIEKLPIDLVIYERE